MAPCFTNEKKVLKDFFFVDISTEVLNVCFFIAVSDSAKLHNQPYYTWHYGQNCANVITHFFYVYLTQFQKQLAHFIKKKARKWQSKQINPRETHINEGESEKWQRDLEIREKKRSVDDDERILWMDFSFPSDSRTSLASAQTATWETERKRRDERKEQNHKHPQMK